MAGADLGDGCVDFLPEADCQLAFPVLLLESALANVPVVFGHFRPVILVPAGLLAGLPPEQIQAILLHELAHIRRCDYAVNFLQRLVEGLFFYHPATWWIARVIRAERENCCDDAAVAITGNAHQVKGLGTNLIVTFIDPAGTGDYRLAPGASR